MEKLIKWADGNPGAATFLMNLFHPQNPALLVDIIEPVLEKAISLRGANLYVLWSDLCDKNLVRVGELCLKCPIEILEDACNRQDYSGRALVAPYFD